MGQDKTWQVKVKHRSVNLSTEKHRNISQIGMQACSCTQGPTSELTFSKTVLAHSWITHTHEGTSRWRINKHFTRWQKCAHGLVINLLSTLSIAQVLITELNCVLTNWFYLCAFKFILRPVLSHLLNLLHTDAHTCAQINSRVEKKSAFFESLKNTLINCNN